MGVGYVINVTLLLYTLKMEAILLPQRWYSSPDYTVSQPGTAKYKT
jgi:hypothetical protein